jgi:hypothetical protein
MALKKLMIGIAAAGLIASSVSGASAQSSHRGGGNVGASGAASANLSAGARVTGGATGNRSFTGGQAFNAGRGYRSERGYRGASIASGYAGRNTTVANGYGRDWRGDRGWGWGGAGFGLGFAAADSDWGWGYPGYYDYAGYAPIYDYSPGYAGVGYGGCTCAR